MRPGSDRIICIGSSETFGLYESYRHEWPRQLEVILNRRAGGPKFEAVDVAYPGMSVGTAILRLPQILTTLSPRIAVIYPSYTPYIERAVAQPWPAPPPGPAPAEQRHYELRIAGKAQTMLKADLPEGLQNWIREEQLKRAARNTTVMERLPDQNIQAFAQDLDTLTTQLQQHGVQVILVTHATRFGKTLSAEDRDYLTSWRKFFPTLSENGLLDMEHRMGEAVQQEGQRRGVMVVDAANEIAPGSRNFAEFVHFTDAGANALATLVANAVDADQPKDVIRSAAIRSDEGPSMHSNGDPDANVPAMIQ